jgi:signal transduction histidine kinase
VLKRRRTTTQSAVSCRDVSFAVAIVQSQVDSSQQPQPAAGSQPARRPILDRLLIGLLATLTVAVVRWWLDPILGGSVAFVVFFIAIIFTAWYSGFWPALCAMAIGMVLASYLFDDSRGSLLIYTFRNQMGCVVYVTVGLYLAYLIDWLTRDIAQRKQIESELRSTQEQLQLHQLELAHMSRLSIMGEMAASLAHELNQPLHAAKNYARGSIRRMLKDPHRDTELMAALEHIADETDRAAGILRRVRDFVQKTAPQFTAISVNDLVQEAVKITNFELKRTAARIVCELASDIRPVRADPVQIEQVVVNLARNGLESMHELPEGQRVLGIGTRRCDEHTVEVFVRDRGTGISELEMPRVFEPFFTTKQEGMGMGLAISRSIINSHEGQIWVSTNDDRGCTFHFTLPVAERPAE